MSETSPYAALWCLWPIIGWSCAWFAWHGKIDVSIVLMFAIDGAIVGPFGAFWFLW